MTKEHQLKVHFDFWYPLERGEKPFEVRYNDRDFQVGDILVLRPIAMTNGHDDNSTDWVYLKGELRKRVTYVLRPAQHSGVNEGYVVLGIENE